MYTIEKKNQSNEEMNENKEKESVKKDRKTRLRESYEHAIKANGKALEKLSKN